MLQTQRKLEQAELSLKKAIALKADYIGAYNNLGIILAAQGKWEEAVTSFDRAIQLKPNYAEAYYNRGNVFHAQGKLEEAVTSFHRAIQLKPDNPEYYNNLGITLEAQGKLGEAVASFQKAIQLNPHYTEAHNNLGNTLSTQGKLERAVASFQKAIQLNPDFPEAYYNLVDPFIVPPEQEQYFREKLVYLPHCYQANDNKRIIAEETPSRAECGLPPEGFVFCNFNNSYKIAPQIFAIWMRLLEKIPDSVLWLLGDNKFMQENLCQQARIRGVTPERLVFAKREKLPKHLARQRLADLFLDTLPYNAHTTTSDALWAGLPVVTCAGRSFASRVAGSLLHAVGLPQLVTYNLADYEALALKLATEPAILQGIREKLAYNRLRMPLFNTEGFSSHIEAAYMKMWTLWQEGKKPQSFAISP